MLPVISIVTLHFNRPMFTSQTLPRLLETTDVPFELILLHNSDESTDATAVSQYLETFEHAKLKVSERSLLRKTQTIRFKKNLGTSAAKNIGTKFMSEYTKAVMFLDDDTLLPKHWASRTMRLLEDEPKIGLIGFRRHAPFEPSLQLRCSKSGIYWDNLGGVNPGAYALVVRKDTFLEAGDFWDKFIYGWEDTDYAIKVSLTGKYTCVIYPDRVIDLDDADAVWKKPIWEDEEAQELATRRFIKCQADAVNRRCRNSQK